VITAVAFELMLDTKSVGSVNIKNLIPIVAVPRLPKKTRAKVYRLVRENVKIILRAMKKVMMIAKRTANTTHNCEIIVAVLVLIALAMSVETLIINYFYFFYLLPTCLNKPIKYFASTNASITPTTSSITGPIEASVVWTEVATLATRSEAKYPVVKRFIEI
jgi:hypothetical protein